jgi:hypothetical protein
VIDEPAEHRDLVSERHGERVDVIARDPGGVGVDRLGRQLDAIAVQCGQRAGHRHRAACRIRGDFRRQLGVRRETPRAVDDHPNGQADLAVDHRGLQLAVAQLDDLVDQPVNSQVGLRRSGRGGGN